MCSKYTAASSAANESQLLGRRSRRVRSRGPCMRSLNELHRDFEWRRARCFRTLEELTEDFERRKAHRVSSATTASSPEITEDSEAQSEADRVSSAATALSLEITKDAEAQPEADRVSSAAIALSLDAAPPGLEIYRREQLLGVLAALPKGPNGAALGIRCVSRVPSLVESNRVSDGERSDCGRDSSVEGDTSPADAGDDLGVRAADTRKRASRLACEEVEGCPSTASGGEPSEGGSFDSEEPWLAEAATWESWPGEGASWKKVPSGMRHRGLWYPNWGYWDFDPAGKQCWFDNCGNYADPGCVGCPYADVGAPALLGEVDLSTEPCWSGAPDAVYA
mmetsp:Transcript_60397/g.140679  ORF Transcript_60397/g.140679 Transcript_60397/m.140679 type:complete len:337 (-) Transcript_60397:47-1057(-)